MKFGSAAQGPYGRRPAAILTAVSLIEGAETSIVIGALPFLQDQWHFSDTWGGALATAAAIAGLFALLPAGWMADHLRRGRLLGFVLATWAVLTTLSAVAFAFWAFFLVRVVLGGAALLDNPPATSLLADCYPPAVRGRVFGYQRLANLIGVGLGIAIGGGVGQAFGWRAAFLVMLIPGVVVAYFCWRLPDPPRGALDHAEAEDGVPVAASLVEEMGRATSNESAEHRSAKAELARVREVLRIPSVRYLYIGLTVAFLGFTGIAFWLPTFLERTHDISEGAASAVTAGTALFAGIVGSLLGGNLGDRWVERGGAAKRIELVTIGLLAGSVVLIGAIALPTFALQVIGIAAAAFLFTLSFPNFAAAAADVLPGAVRGTGFAVFTFLLTLGSAIGPLVVGAVSDATGSLGVALAISVIPAIPGAFVVARVRHTIVADIARARSESAPAPAAPSDAPGYASGSEPTIPT